MSEVWQDRDIRFDLPPRSFALRSGEKEIDSINAVEDTKGNNGIRGALSVSNLRLLWVSHKNAKINLSIGFNSITQLKIKEAESKLRGKTQSLYVLAQNASTKYEFIFTSLVKASPRLFTTTQSVYKAYDTSRLFRELKLRGSLIKENNLRTLPGEEICDKIPGVWNLSSDQGNLGTFIFTNVRIVWFASLAANFNVSIPFIQISEIRTKNSKFGEALVIQITAREGGYVLGFRIDPKEKLAEISETVRKLHQMFLENPNFGVSFAAEPVPKALNEITEKRVEEDATITEDYEDDLPIAFSQRRAAAHAAYVSEDSERNPEVTEGGEQADSAPQYCAELGCAIQKMPKGVTAASLWSMG